VLPLRGKIPQRASRSSTKLADNQLLSDLIQRSAAAHRQPLSRGGPALREGVVMTDADVDGAHIASL